MCTGRAGCPSFQFQIRDSAAYRQFGGREYVRTDEATLGNLEELTRL